MATRVAVFASGGGTNFSNLARHAQEIGIEIVLLISDNREAYSLRRAEALGIESLVCTISDYGSKATQEAAMIRALQRLDVEYILLAGYMRILGAAFISTYEDRIINLHPSLLPAFKGRNGIEDAYDYGVKVTGVTIHLVDAGIDTGRIIAQEPVRINPEDSLEDLERKIHQLEYQLYPQALKKFLEGERR